MNTISKTMFDNNGWFHCLLNHNIIFRVFQQFEIFALAYSWELIEKFELLREYENTLLFLVSKVGPRVDTWKNLV